MDEQEKKGGMSDSTQIVFAAAFGAVVGAVIGIIAMMVLSSSAGFNLLPQQTTQEQTPQVVEQQIVELIEEESATIAVVERVTPAVVSIVVKQRRGDMVGTSYSSSFFYSPYYNNVDLSEEEADELVEISSGTGFFVTSDGYLLTNRHVVDTKNASFFVVTSDGEEIAATLVDTDPFQDIAILQVEGDGHKVVTLADSDGIRIGQTVIAIGNTLSEYRNTVTKGVVSGINRRVTAGSSVSSEIIDQAIQTDAAINPGNSGGPLINLLGEVIGINTATSFEGESVSFAIPINDAKRAIEDVQEYGKIVRPWLGVRYVLVAPEAGQELGVEYEIGAMIIAGDQPGEDAIFDGSPADLAGLLEGDVIVAVNGTYLTTENALGELISIYRPGDAVTLEILRGSTAMTVDATLGEYLFETNQ